MQRKVILVTALFSTCLAASGLAAETVTINRANPLDDTMRFYLHPAHLYLSTQAPHPAGEHPAVVVKRHEAQINSSVPIAAHPHPALLGRGNQPVNIAQTPFGQPYP